MELSSTQYRFVDMEPKAVMDDVYNAVHDLACDAVDAMEMGFRSEVASRGEALDEATTRTVATGLDQLLTGLQRRTEQHMDRFESCAMAHCFHIPSALTLEKAASMEVSLDATGEKEAALDAELRELRMNIAVMRGRTAEMKAESASLDGELSACNDVSGQLRAAVAGKENGSVAEDAAAIAAAALALQPLLERAEAIHNSNSVIPSRGGTTETLAADKEVRRRRSAAGGASNRELWSLTTRLRV